MKRLFRLMLIAAIAVVAQSCEGPTGPEGPMGPAGPAGKSFTSITKDWQVVSEKWEYNADDCYFYFTTEVPELDEEISLNADISVYCWDLSQTTDFQYQLPYILHEREKVGETTNPTTGKIEPEYIYWDRTTMYDIEPGYITVRVSYSDFADEMPPSMDFRLVVHY